MQRYPMKSTGTNRVKYVDIQSTSLSAKIKSESIKCRACGKGFDGEIQAISARGSHKAKYYHIKCAEAKNII